MPITASRITLTRIESAAESTEKSLSKLTATGKDSVFNKVEKTAEDGTKTQEYDRDAIYKAVKSYVDDYNSLLDRADDSKTKSILRAANSLKSNARANEKTLEKAGITVDADGRLSVDEKSFEKADMDKLKSLFTTHGSYATQTNVDLLKIASNAKSEAAKANTYSKNGMYTYNYSTGDLYNSGI